MSKESERRVKGGPGSWTGKKAAPALPKIMSVLTFEAGGMPPIQLLGLLQFGLADPPPPAQVYVAAWAEAHETSIATTAPKNQDPVARRRDGRCPLRCMCDSPICCKHAAKVPTTPD